MCPEQLARFTEEIRLDQRWRPAQFFKKKKKKSRLFRDGLCLTLCLGGFQITTTALSFSAQLQTRPQLFLSHKPPAHATSFTPAVSTSSLVTQPTSLPCFTCRNHSTPTMDLIAYEQSIFLTLRKADTHLNAF